MKKLALLFCCLVMGLGSGWAGVTGTTNPALFSDSVDWCVQYGCNNDYTVFPTPEPWTSAPSGITGLVGLVGTGQGFYNLQQGVTWNGNFSSGMGLIYNGASFGNTPADIAATFNQGLTGAGAYIQANIFGPFTATITLFDVNDQPLGSFSWNGTSDTNVGTALFIGAFGSAPVWAAEFNVVDVNGNDDFSLGTLKLSTTSPVPEPSSLLLFGSSALGLAGVLRRRFKGVL